MIIYVISNTILNERNISGGDIVLPKLSRYLNPELKLVIVTNIIGKTLWEKYGDCTDFHLITDLIDVKMLWFAPVKYILRTIQLFIYFFKISKNKDKLVVYTSSDLFPDTLPIFFHKIINKELYWISRIYHINKSPLKRKGNPLHNLFSYLAQRVSLPLIKFKSDLILTLSGTYQTLRNMNFPETRTEILNAGVNEQLIKSAPISNEKFECFYLGSIIHTKGVFDLLETWAKVVKTRKNYQLAVIGGGDKNMTSKLLMEISALKLNNNVKYFGRIEKDEDVYTIVKSSKVCIIPGHENGWSLPATEAMTAGIPVVAYALDMFGESFKKGFVTVPLYDQNALANKICEVLENDSLWESLHQEALSESNRFSWKYIAIDLEKHLINLN